MKRQEITRRITTYSVLFVSLTLIFLACRSTNQPPQPAPEPSVGFVLSVDPQAGLVTLASPQATIAVQDVTPPGETRVLVNGVDLEMASFSYAFKPGNVLEINASFKNITTGFNFIKPFFFSSAQTPAEGNYVSSSEPVLTDADLGGDGVLDPEEVTAEVVFSVEHSGAPFTYLVIANSAVEAVVDGILLPGNPTEPAAKAAFDYEADNPYAESEIGELPSGVQFLRSVVEVLFTDDTTVGEVNDFLRRYDASIVSMVRNTAAFTIHFPDPGSLEALETIIAEMESEPNVLAVLRAVEVSLLSSDLQPQIVPTLDSTTLRRMSHHLAVRAHAAWNLLPFMEQQPKPWLLISDSFGDGPPNSDFAVAVEDSGDFENITTGFDHGYQVLGIMTGTFQTAGTTDERGQVTGISPLYMSVRAVDTASRRKFDRIFLNNIIQRANEIVDAHADAVIVLNTSQAVKQCNQDRSDGLSWLKKVRNNDLEERVIHVAGAGNISTCDPGDVPAANVSPWNYAALNDITTRFGRLYPRLVNTLVVENVQWEPAGDSRPQTLCLYPDSITGGTIAGIGTDVWTFTRTGATLARQGTSLSAPQVAGVASLIAATNSNLTPEEIVDIIIATSRNATGEVESYICKNAQGQPIVDAYDAILAAGGEEARLFLLDVAGAGPTSGSNDAFDHNDIELFLTEFERDQLDYSRYDLNGDGRTGGSTTDRFDLDGTNTPSFTTLSLEIEGETVTFDESELTDLEILCYYSYSRYYTGDLNDRRTLLGERCGPASFPSFEGILYQTIPSSGDWDVNLIDPDTLNTRIVVDSSENARWAVWDSAGQRLYYTEGANYDNVAHRILQPDPGTGLFVPDPTFTNPLYNRTWGQDWHPFEDSIIRYENKGGITGAGPFVRRFFDGTEVDPFLDPAWVAGYSVPSGGAIDFFEYPNNTIKVVWQASPPSNAPGNDIFIADINPSTGEVDRSTIVNLTPNGVGDYFPRFSPDGSKVAFMRAFGGNRHGPPKSVIVMTINCTPLPGCGQETQLIDVTDPNRPDDIASGFAWSPDGSEIVISPTKAGNHDLYLIASGVAGQRMADWQQLTSTPTVDEFLFDWR